MIDPEHVAAAWPRRRIERDFEIIDAFADKIGASVSTSRAAMDTGYVSNETLAGPTGKIIDPKPCEAIGTSTSIRHLTGILDAGTIVAINRDGKAPTFETPRFWPGRRSAQAHSVAVAGGMM